MLSDIQRRSESDVSVGARSTTNRVDRWCPHGQCWHTAGGVGVGIGVVFDTSTCTNTSRCTTRKGGGVIDTGKKGTL